ncbi:hypothetical protein CEXT_49581 [Caerostris extrusa]|uniref:Uncharacterized protein n=1 Tax=Caerostris extrusa TaxID=172846 RepID=A0AAV4VB46_CAEEX|nr:hypothetical protein CEXT_49581 [Caerostris extrusa]
MNICEFCNAYIANFEVHSCRKFGNQQHQSSATLPRSSSDIKAQDIDSVSSSKLTMKHNGHLTIKLILQRSKAFFRRASKIDCGDGSC